MDNFSDFFQHLVAKPIIVYNLPTKNVNFHILFLFLPPTVTLLYPSGGQKIKFCTIKSLIFNGSCSNFEHFSLKMGPIFLQSLKNIFKNKNFLYLSIIKNCEFFTC